MRKVFLMDGRSIFSSNPFPLCPCFFPRSNTNEELKQQSSELAEQLKLKGSQNQALSLELDELHKRLEMADVMLQQVTRALMCTEFRGTGSVTLVMW